MSDTTITPEERASWRERLENPFSCHDAKHGAFTLRLLTALEAAEAQRDKALQMNAERQAAITEAAINALLTGVTGEKKSVGLNVSGYNCPYCGEISKTVADATAHDAICPKHPAVMRATKAEADLSRVKGAGIEALRRAEQAEAEAARLTAERDWLAERCAELCDDDEHYGFLGHDESAKLWKRKAEEAALPGRGGGRRGEIMRHDEDLMYAEADGYVHFYCGSISYMEEGTLCGLGCDNPDVKDTDKTIVTCPQCIRILKVLRTVPFKERAVPVEG